MTGWFERKIKKSKLKKLRLTLNNYWLIWKENSKIQIHALWNILNIVYNLTHFFFMSIFFKQAFLFRKMYFYYYYNNTRESTNTLSLQYYYNSTYFLYFSFSDRVKSWKAPTRASTLIKVHSFILLINYSFMNTRTFFLA